MRTILAGVLILCASTVTAHAEPAVFKCVKTDGTTIFSPTPCGKDAKEVDTTAALRTGTSPNVQGVSDRAALADIDNDCAVRERDIRDTSDRDLRLLRADLRRSANNYAGATRDNGIRAQIDGVISRRDADLNGLVASCEQRRDGERQRQADRDSQQTAQGH